MKKYFNPKNIALTLISVISSMSFSSALAVSNYGLSSTQIQQIKLLYQPIVVPAYLPKGFILKSVNIVNSSEKTLSNYKLIYSKTLPNGKISEFYLETTVDSIGHLYLSNPVKVKSSLGATQIYVDSFFENDNPGQMKNCIFMDWLPYKKNYYRIASGGGCNTEIKDDGYIQRISKEEAIKILSSLKEIK